jgi:predicted nucleic acid-binding protein
MFLLDTDVLSFAGPTSSLTPDQREQWRRWVHDHQAEIFWSTISLMEVRYGIERARLKGATRKAEQLNHWLVGLEVTYRDRLVPVTSTVANLAGALLAKAETAGSQPSSEDALIAASAELGGFILITRNGRDMAAMTDRWRDPLSL